MSEEPSILEEMRGRVFETEEDVLAFAWAWHLIAFYDPDEALPVVRHRLKEHPRILAHIVDHIVERYYA